LLVTFISRSMGGYSADASGIVVIDGFTCGRFTPVVMYAVVCHHHSKKITP
jgi:hypothetical protein